MKKFKRSIVAIVLIVGMLLSMNQTTVYAKTNAYIEGGIEDVGADIFQRGVCLPSDNKMTAVQQERIIEVIKACFE